MTPRIAFPGALAAALLLAGCAGDEPTPLVTPAPGDGQADARPAHAAAPGKDSCSLSAARSYVGKLRTELPVPIQPSLQRVVCTTCPVTLEFNPWRVNFLFDAETGVIKEVKCG